MSQTAYANAPKFGRVGALADNGHKDSISKIASVAIAVGCLVVRDADDKKAKHPTSAAEVLSALSGAGGVAMQDFTLVNDPNTAIATIPVQKEFNALRRGRIHVLLEEAVTQGDQAYARFADGVGDVLQVQKGSFRKSADASGTAIAQVDTFTPSAVDATVYALEIKSALGHLIAVAEFKSGTSTTATLIVTGLKAALGTVPGITLSGTSTLILTSSVAGTAFTSQSVGDGTLTKVATTANVSVAATAAIAPGCYFAASGAKGDVVPLSVNMGGV